MQLSMLRLFMEEIVINPWIGKPKEKLNTCKTAVNQNRTRLKENRKVKNICSYIFVDNVFFVLGLFEICILSYMNDSHCRR